MGSVSPEVADGGGLRQCRNARSLDMGTSSTREASKAAAWMWHMHSTSPTFKTEDEDKQANYTMWESKRRSNSCDRKDSRFRQEAASASTIFHPASASKRAASSTSVPDSSLRKPPASKPLDSSVWDCGSKLYDTFELVSFSNRLDRSLLGVVPAFDAPNNSCHALQSPLHHSSFAGVLRTFSLPRMLSVHNSMPLTNPPNDNGNHGKGEDGMINARANPEAKSSPVANHAFQADVQGAVGRPIIERKFSALRRALTTKWTLSKIVKILEKVAKFHKQMHCFRPHAGRDRNAAITARRSELIVEKDDDGGLSEHGYFWPWHSSRDKKDHRREHVDEEDDDGSLSEHRYRVYEEKVNEGKAGKHFHHHHHHYHHHFVHHLDQLSQAAKEDNVCTPRPSSNGIGTDAEWPPALPTRTESARLSSDTMFKICADVNWL